MNNTHYNNTLGIKAGLFGYFEVVDDQAVANALFETAFEWARQQGFNEILGPNGLMTTEQTGVLIEGFEHRPALNVPYNYPYYQKFFEDAGFEKDREALSGHIRIAGRKYA